MDVDYGNETFDISRARRVFTVACRTIDATWNSQWDRCDLTWSIPEGIVPPDVPRDAIFRVAYTFNESQYAGGVTDTSWTNRRNHPVYCDLAKYNHATNYTGLLNINGVNLFTEGSMDFGCIGYLYYYIHDTSGLTHSLSGTYAGLDWVGAMGQYPNLRIGPGGDKMKYRTDRSFFTASHISNRKSITISYRQDLPDYHNPVYFDATLSSGLGFAGARNIDTSPCYLVSDWNTGGAHMTHWLNDMGGGSVGNADISSATPQPPVFYTMARGNQPPLLIDLGPPLGTHVFEFFLVD